MIFVSSPIDCSLVELQLDKAHRLDKGRFWIVLEILEPSTSFKVHTSLAILIKLNLSAEQGRAASKLGGL